MSAVPSETAREWTVVGAVYLALVALTAVWLAIDRRPPEWDHANHLERVVHCAQDMARGDVRAIIERSSFYPPVVPCAAALVYRLAPSDAAAGQSVILAFLGLGMAAVYLLGRRLAGGAEGVAAAIVFGCAPFVVFSSLRFQLDLPLAAMVATALAVVLLTDGFTRLGWSLVAGVVFAVGMLTKPPFAAYVLVPVALVVASSRERRRATINTVLAIVVAAALSLPWYGPRLLGLAPQIASRSFKQAAESGHADPLTATALLFYPTWLVPQFGVLAVLLLLIGLAVAVIRRSVKLEPGALAFAMSLPGPDVAARVRVLPASDRPFALAADHVTIGGIPVPAMLVDWVVRTWDPSPRIASRLPVPVSVGRIEITPEAIRISARQ